ncbi:MAG: DNRLRE domain-containing protein [Verrucomicrobiota bacterium]|nr:DNRLRE domain-containing protein [Verrucomicrobiota bacterium]
MKTPFLTGAMLAATIIGNQGLYLVSGAQAITQSTDGGPLATYEDAAAAVQRDAFSYGATVFAKFSGADTDRCYRFRWFNPNNQLAAEHDVHAEGEVVMDMFTVPSAGPSGAWTLKILEATADSAAPDCPSTYNPLSPQATFEVARAAMVGAQAAGGVGGDAYVEDKTPTTPHDGPLILVERMNSAGQETSRGLVRFELAGTGISGSVVEAELRWRETAGPDATQTLEVHRASSTWQESTVTWDTQPDFDGRPTDIQSAGLGAGVTRWDVTGDVNGFINGSFPNYGWLIKDGSEGGDTGDLKTRFPSTASSTTDKTRWPVLLVDYNDLVIAGPTNVIVRNDPGQCTASVTFTANISGGVAPVAVACEVGDTPIVSPHVFPVGTTMVKLTATDAAGYTATTNFTVTVMDTEGPVPDVATLPTVTGVGSAAIASAPTATDQCAGPVTGTTTDPMTYNVPGTYTVTWRYDDGHGNIVAQTQTVIVTASQTLPPDPAAVAPPLDRSAATTLEAATAFLYTGPNPIQTNVAPGTIKPVRAAVLRGRVAKKDGSPLSGVAITVLNHPEFGSTLSQSDGLFDLAVNGGGPLTVSYAESGFLPVQRQVNAPWQDYTWAPGVVMLPLDSQVTIVNLNGPAMQVARGNPVTDADGTRQATMLFPAGTGATLQLPDGTEEPVGALSIRATEFTVGTNGPAAMPAPLPPSSGYTYCVELSADEAIAAGATAVRFNQPVISYVENFIGFPVGTPVPAGYYDRERGQWVASENGRVIKILSITGGLADLDVDGSGAAASASRLGALGITAAEQAQLASLYAPGQSLWRVPITHLTPWDYNWPYCPPADATPPNQPKPKADKPIKDSCEGKGSIIELQNQILRQTIGLVGVPFTLNYSSDRVPGRTAANTLTISLSGATVPASLKRIELEVSVAGQPTRQTFPAATNLTTTYTWDGKDAYGRAVQGQQAATVRIGYVYPAIYQQPDQTGRSFAALSGVPMTGGRAGDVTLWQETKEVVGSWDARSSGLGGWDLNVHHAYSPNGKTIYYGDGEPRDAQVLNRVIDTIPGLELQYIGIGEGMATGPDGSLYVTDTYDCRVLRVSPNGTITTVAGGGTYYADGVPATEAGFGWITDVALGKDGSLYIAGGDDDPRLRRVDTNGIIWTVAGNSTYPTGGSDGDGDLAVNAPVSPELVAAAPDGSLYIEERLWGYGGEIGERIRKIGNDGYIHTIFQTEFGPSSGDGGPLSQAQTGRIYSITIGPDGSLYLADLANHRIRRVGADGIITTVAGNGQWGGVWWDGREWELDFLEDGLPATQVALGGPEGLFVGADGSLYFWDDAWRRIFCVGTDGILKTIAGNGGWPDSDDGGPAGAAQVAPVDWNSLTVAPDGSLYFATWDNTVRRVTPLLPGFSDSEIVLPSEDGSELYVFDPYGKHLRTVDTLTGNVLYQFGYDATGLLVTVTDLDNNVTTIERDAYGNPTAIVGPYGARTSLWLDANGYLNAIQNPASETVQFTYSADGLMQTLTDARQHTHHFTYDSLGRLAQDTDPAGGFTHLDRAEWTDGYEVTSATAMNYVSRYRVEDMPAGEQRRINTGADNAQTTNIIGPDGLTTTFSPDGTFSSVQQGPDPRWGMLAPLPQTMTERLPSGLTSTVTTERAVTLADPANPLSLTSQTDSVTVNGLPFTSVYDTATRTIATTSPLGRQSVSLLDAQGRVIQSAIPAVAPVNFQYDSRGRLQTVSQTADGQTRTVAYTYDQTQNGGPSSGRLIAVTDSLNRTATFSHDPNLSGRVVRQTFQNGRFIEFQYDANGNLTGVTPPQKPQHLFDFNAVDLLQQYTPPPAPLTGNIFTTYEYNLDRQLTKITRPDGQLIQYIYDPQIGRLDHISLPFDEQISFRYNGPGCGCSGVGRPSDVTFNAVDYTGAIHYDYDGSLVTGVTWSGPVAGSVNATYDNFLRVSALSVNGANPVSFGYDDDGLLTQAGGLILARDAQNGRLTGTTLGEVNDSWTYNGFGEAQSYTARVGGDTLYAVSVIRDSGGRITTRTETIGGATSEYGYLYDPDRGWLTDVSSNGVPVAHYDYDDNGNCTHVLTLDREVNYAAADDQDRILGATETLAGQGPQTVGWTYTANGEWLTKTVGADTTGYGYDAQGNLRQVRLPKGTQIEYVLDATGCRIGRAVNGTLVQGWLYQDPLKPIAELDGAGNVVSRFVYAGKANVPEYMLKGGATYRLITDQLGSVRLVVDVSSGAIAQRMDYDEFGRVLSDSNPGFQPFGYAGGLYDPDTGLVHFGARDYDSDSGRWTSKDPIGFGGGDANLYTYVANDPLNLIDSLGLMDCNFAQGIIAHMEGLITGAIQSMGAGGPIQEVAHNADRMWLLAAAGEVAQGISTIGFLASDLVASTPALFQQGGKEYVISARGLARAKGTSTYYYTLRRAVAKQKQVGVETAEIEAGTDLANDVVSGGASQLTGLPIDIMNEAEAVSEREVEMANEMSASTYHTVRHLQGQLAGMLNTYKKNCCNNP